MCFLGVSFLDDQKREIDFAYQPGIFIATLAITFLSSFLCLWLGTAAEQYKFNAFPFSTLAATAGIVGSHFAAVAGLRMHASINWTAGPAIGAVCTALVLVGVAIWLFQSRVQQAWFTDYRVIGACAFFFASGTFSFQLITASGLIVEYQPTRDWDGVTKQAVIVLVVVFISLALLLLASVGVVAGRNRTKVVHELKDSHVYLGALVIDSKNRVLFSQDGFLPQAEISPKDDIDGPQLDNSRQDFLRMLKASFNWGLIDRMQLDLRKKVDRKQIRQSALDVFIKFALAAQKLAELFNIDIHRLGLIYAHPVGSHAVIVMRAGSHNGWTKNFRFAPRDVVVKKLNSYWHTEQYNGVKWDADRWIDSCLEYYDNCLRPVKTKGDGIHAFDDPSGTITWLEKQKFSQNTMRTLTDYDGQDLMDLTKDDSKALLGVKEGLRLFNRIQRLNTRSTGNIYVGLFVTHLVRNSIQILVPAKGPYHIVPHVKLDWADGAAGESLDNGMEWLKALARDRDWCDTPLNPSLESATFGYNCRGFQKAFLAASEELALMVGTNRHLLAKNIYTVQLVQLNPSLRLILYVASSDHTPLLPPSLPRQHSVFGSPVYYNVALVKILPFLVFDTIQSAQHPTTKPQGWINLVLSWQSDQRKMYADVGMGDDMGLESGVGGDRSRRATHIRSHSHGVNMWKSNTWRSSHALNADSDSPVYDGTSIVENGESKMPDHTSMKRSSLQRSHEALSHFIVEGLGSPQHHALNVPHSPPGNMMRLSGSVSTNGPTPVRRPMSQPPPGLYDPNAVQVSKLPPIPALGLSSRTCRSYDISYRMPRSSREGSNPLRRSASFSDRAAELQRAKDEVRRELNANLANDEGLTTPATVRAPPRSPGGGATNHEPPGASVSSVSSNWENNGSVLLTRFAVETEKDEGVSSQNSANGSLQKEDGVIPKRSILKPYKSSMRSPQGKVQAYEDTFEKIL